MTSEEEELAPRGGSRHLEENKAFIFNCLNALGMKNHDIEGSAFLKEHFPYSVFLIKDLSE